MLKASRGNRETPAAKSRASAFRASGDAGTHWGNIRVTFGLYGDNGQEEIVVETSTLNPKP